MSKIAFMFPGQGAQTAGMGKDFYEHSEIARNIIDRSSGLLKLDMKSLCFEENENLHQTEYTQAALVTVCMAMEQVLRTSGVKPDVTAGLSLGEYCAIASAGCVLRKMKIFIRRNIPRQHLLRSVWQWSRCCVHPV